ncbi:MAG: PhoU domain-containing protein [Planctomycetota bacterium]|nr:PhoU domain-containing protein [Planctomycetota bacterium]MEC8651168.1 PhoU domain-containing protein [Planctomycetota bacterium]MEC9048499.1 PhoU domain-containing protein [Planctomycetota bacterium]
MSSHYEERLVRDLSWIDELVGIVGEANLRTLEQSVRAVLQLDKELAAKTILEDYVTNRQTRELDRLCHAFVACHLPSAGHLRTVSAVLRLSIGLERIGDYSTTISRTASQLSTPPPPVVARDIEMMAEHAHRLLRDALRSFRKRDVELAKSTVASATQFARYFDKVFDDLAQEGEANSRPSSELFALMATFNRLERIIHQAKNICEETVFVVNGQTKGEKTFTILFLDRDNTGASQLAEHFTAKAFPNSGRYRSAGLEPGEIIAPNYREFAQSVGIDMARAWPVDFDSLREELTEFDLIIALEPSLRDSLGRLPFHTNMLTWSIDLGEGPEIVYRQLTPKIRELMELLRGEQAS